MPDTPHLQKNVVNVLHETFAADPNGHLVSTRFILDAYYDADPQRRENVQRAVDIKGKLPMLVRKNKFHISHTGFLVSATIMKAMMHGRVGSHVVSQIVPEPHKNEPTNTASATDEPFGVHYVERTGHLIVVDRKMREVTISLAHKLPFHKYSMITQAAKDRLKNPTAAVVIGLKGREVLLVADSGTGGSGLLAGSCSHVFNIRQDAGDKETELVVQVGRKAHKRRQAKLASVHVTVSGCGAAVQPLALAASNAAEDKVVYVACRTGRLFRLQITEDRCSGTNCTYLGTAQLMATFPAGKLKSVSALTSGGVIVAAGKRLCHVWNKTVADVLGEDGNAVKVRSEPFGVACTKKGKIYVTDQGCGSVYLFTPPDCSESKDSEDSAHRLASAAPLCGPWGRAAVRVPG